MNKSVVALFLCAEHFYFQDQHLFSCVDPLLLCYRVLNMGRVVLFLCFSVIFKSLIKISFFFAFKNVEKLTCQTVIDTLMIY